MKRRTLILSVVVVVAVALAAWHLQRLLRVRSVVRNYLPTPSAPTGVPAELTDRIAQATVAAREGTAVRDNLVELSRLYHANGFTPEAIACYEALRRIEPRTARWSHLEARLLADLGRTADAITLERSAVDSAPDYLPARLQLGDLLLKANRPADAAAIYADVLRRAPGEPYALLGLARGDLQRGDWHQARERLREATNAHPDFVGGLSLLVTVNERLGETATAHALQQTIGKRQHADATDPWLEELWPDCFDPYRLSVMAAISSSAGNNPRARELLERAVALAPETSSHRRNLAQILLNDSNPAAARGQLERAVSADPGDADAWLLLVEALRKLNQGPAALQRLAQGLTHSPQSGGLHLEMARELAGQQRIAEAIVEFRTAAALRPTEATPLVELADTYLSAGRAEEGLAALHEALSRQPRNPFALTSLMFYHIVTGDDAAALRYWQEVRQQPRTPAALLERLRSAYQRRFDRPLP